MSEETLAPGLAPEVLSEALAICFRDDDEFEIKKVMRAADKPCCDALFTIGGERFYLSVWDESLERRTDAAAVSEQLLAYNMPEVVKSMPDFQVSVTVSGCILGEA